ncbi:class I SAM-dependent methyltransferase [Chloracidobacterium validum]|uniref:Class I SAM-dependent methyltransferase n=1 Tax=Chloracidobacterium validum TaxID=2821543 RepID=A0ABX8BCB6_9BACT|nr:class I SAM-dependent methyltransferase [Chloracidobacterium validum]QUW04571.1 class I SAM-dependent methyltransferase [Chloracidobacterium validum]
MRDFRPALAFPALTPWFDAVAKVAIRDDVLKRRLSALLPLEPGQSVLDVGCGTGTLLLHLHERQPQARLFGVDADPVALAIAEQKGRRAGVAWSLTRASATELPFPDGQFEVVVTSLVFHHLTTPQKQRALREIRRVLNPRGRLLLADYGAPQTWLEALAFLPVRLFDGFDVTEANVQGQLPDQMRQSGFATVECRAELPTAFGYITAWQAQPAPPAEPMPA